MFYTLKDFQRDIYFIKMTYGWAKIAYENEKNTTITIKSKIKT